MTLRTTLACISTLSVLATGCGGSSFGGNSGKQAQADQSGAKAPATAPASGGASGPQDGAPSASASNARLTLDPPANPTPQQEAIGKCLKQWSNAPFDGSVYSNYREIDAAVSIFGGGGYAVEDTQATDQPALIVIAAAVSVLGSANYLLMNPNGYYCIMADVNVSSTVEVDVQCKAKMADSSVEVNVGSNADNASSVGVNVFSNLKVVREASQSGRRLLIQASRGGRNPGWPTQ